MLTQLLIRSFGLIDHVSIAPGPGLNVVTGETGAGKSLLVKALNLLAGAKSSPDMVRKGSEEALLCGEFQIDENHGAVAVAIENGVFTAEDARGSLHLILRRRLTAKGKSFCYINDLPVTLGVFKDVGSALLDIFGQHDNHRLLNPAQHLSFVDRFLPDARLKAQVTEKYRNMLSVVEKLRAIAVRFDDQKRNSDYLLFRIQEWDELQPSEADYQAVFQQCERGRSSVRDVQALQKAVSLLEEEMGLTRPFHEIYKLLGRSVDMDVGPLGKQAAEIARSIEDLSFSLAKKLESFTESSNSIEVAESRLAAYQGLFRKYGVKDISELMAAGERLREEFDFLQTAATEAGELLQGLVPMLRECEKVSAQLTEARRKAIQQLAKSVDKELKDMAMPSARLSFHLEPIDAARADLNLSAISGDLQEKWDGLADALTKFSAHGAETGYFILVSNKGEDAMPLHKMASGGELSRIMLAMKTIAATELEPSILVFDEIDAGISGRVADVVGRKLKHLARTFQVVCISHLAQVASYGDWHFTVRKSEKSSRTVSSIARIQADERTQEIARLLSGEEITGASLSNAKTLLEKASSASH